MWFKSSYSSDQGGACLEVAYHWHKSTHSSDQGGNCVEVAAHPTAVHMPQPPPADDHRGRHDTRRSRHRPHMVQVQLQRQRRR
ncbi:DUF397 domain-containing protein [Streptomyces halstedii]|uniref:DUF397 domain-containing protein n=1 Tax=Streptomyces halstedii TaxID=1944 RepID=UPI00384CAD39